MDEELSPCGRNTECKIRHNDYSDYEYDEEYNYDDHDGFCTCKPGYVGDPYEDCVNGNVNYI